MTTEELAWLVAADRYANTCAMNGTPAERASLWAKASDALDKFIEHNQAELKARSKRDTLSVPAIPVPGRPAQRERT